MIEKAKRRYSSIFINNKSGFTLMELVIIIGVMTVLALLMVPNATAYVQKADDARIETNIREVHKASELVVQTNPNMSVKDIYKLNTNDTNKLVDEIAKYANIDGSEIKIVEYALANENSSLNMYYVSPSKIPNKIVVRFNTDRGTYWFEKKSEDVAGKPGMPGGSGNTVDKDDVNFEGNEDLEGESVSANNVSDGKAIVEVEGKSYQPAGNGSNLVPNFEKWELSSNAKFEDNILTIPAGQNARFTLYTNGKPGRYWYNFKMLKGATYIINSAYYDLDGQPTKEASGLHNGNGYAAPVEVEKEIHRSNYTDWNSNIHKVVITLRPFAEVNQWHPADSRDLVIKDFSLTLGQMAYEPPSQSPDDPIEIESLKSFDIVSSQVVKNRTQLASIPYDTIKDGTYKTKVSLGNPLRSVGDAKDKLYKDTDNLWKIRREVAEIKYDGQQRFTRRLNTNPEYTSYYDSYGSSVLHGKGVMSNKYKYIHYSGSYHNRTEIQISQYIDTTAKFIITDKTMSESEWSAKLAEKPLIVLYPLKNPTVEILSRPAQDKLNNIPSFKGENNIYTIVDNHNLSPKLGVRFELYKQSED